MPDPDVIIVGNGVAGFAAADRLARNGMRSLLIGPGPVADRPPLSKGALLTGEPTLFGEADALAQRGIARLDGWAEDVDLSAGEVIVRQGNERLAVTAAAVILAVGLDYAPPPIPIPGLELAEVNATPAGMVSLSRRLGSAQRVVIVGAGLIGTETAATLAGAGHAVTVVDLEPRPLHRVHDPVPDVAETALLQAGATFIGGFRLEQIERTPDGALVVSASDGTQLPADVVVAAMGGRQQPIPGISDQTGPITVAPGMRIPGHDAAFIVGDCAVPLHERFGRLTFPHWDVAMGTGILAADAILGKETAYSRLPYWWTEIGATRIGEVGVAAVADEWSLEDDLHVGRDAAGEIVCVTVVNQPRRMREARELLTVTP